MLARSHRRLNELAKAESAYRDCVRIDPSDTEAIYELALVHVEMGDLDAARRAWSQLARSDRELAALIEGAIQESAR